MTFKTFLSLAGAAAIVAAPAAVHAAMTVQPVILDLKSIGRDTGGQIRVENTGSSPLPVEMHLLEADLLPDTVKASDRVTDDLIAMPAQAIIPPGGTQAFRIQYVGDPESAKSRHFYAEVAQLPVAIPGGQSTIQVLYNFQAMINVASSVAGEPHLSIEGAKIVHADPDKPARIAFTVHNSGQNYGYLSNGSVTLVQKAPDGSEEFRRTLSKSDVQQMIGFGLVGPETSREFIAPVDLENGDGSAEVKISSNSR